MNKKELLHRIKQCLQPVYGDRLRGVVLYGSEARNEAEKDSDIDILVLLAGPVSRLQEHRIIISAIYDFILELDRPVHAKPVDVAVYEAAECPLYINAKEEGIVA